MATNNEPKAEAKLTTITSKGAILSGITVEAKMSVSYNEDDKAAKDSYEQKVIFDFTGCTLEQVLGWAMADRRIALQRGLRAIESKDQFVAFITAGDSIRVLAADAGKKPQAPKTQEQLAAEAKASFAQLSPEMQAEILKMLQAQE